jgi:dTDP-4-dehydrorhamnose 3,5-epimerase
MPDCVPGKIAGVWIKKLAMFADDRGTLAEMLRSDDPFFGSSFEKFGQTTFTLSYPGVIKAFHWHRRQDDAWFVGQGMIQAVLHDLRPDSPTCGLTEAVCLGQWRPLLLVIPRGVAHGYRVLGAEPAWLVYHTSAVYDPAEPDEERIAFDDPAIGFDWTTQPR